MSRIWADFPLRFISNNIFLQESKEETNKTTLNDSKNSKYEIEADALGFLPFVSICKSLWYLMRYFQAFWGLYWGIYFAELVLVAFWEIRKIPRQFLPIKWQWRNYGTIFLPANESLNVLTLLLKSQEKRWKLHSKVSLHVVKSRFKILKVYLNYKKTVRKTKQWRRFV